MSDETLLKDSVDEPRLDISRRWFLQGAVAVGAATMALGQGRSEDVRFEKPRINDGTGTANCECVIAAELQIMAAASYQGQHFAVVGTESGPGLFELGIDNDRVSLGKRVEMNLPDGFTFGSMGIGRGGLVVSGGLPFVLETIEVDYEMPADTLAAMGGHIPDDIPTSGFHKVDIMGVEPALFMIGRPHTERIQLPPMIKRSFATATAITQTNSGGIALLIEHSDGINESFYASAVDVIEESGRDWNIWNAGRDLGESGPHYLASTNDGLIAAINSGEGSVLTGVRSSRRSSDRVIALISDGNGPTALLKDQAGNSRWSTLNSDGSFVGDISAELANDEVIGAVAVGGAPGQAIVLGRRSTMLVGDIQALVSRTKGGE